MKYFILKVLKVITGEGTSKRKYVQISSNYSRTGDEQRC